MFHNFLRGFMSQWKKFSVCALILLVCQVFFIRTTAAADAIWPDKRVNEKGIVSLTWDFGNIPLGRGFLPARLVFTSATDPMLVSSIPRKWTCSMIDSVSILIDENKAVFYLPDGRAVTALQGDLGKNRRWTQTSEDRVALIWDSAEYEFVKGRLASVTEDGDELRWKYDDQGRCIAILRRGKPVLELERESQSGLTTLEVIPKQEANLKHITLQYDTVPSLASLVPEEAMQGLSAQMRTIQMKADGRFICELSQTDESSELLLSAANGSTLATKFETTSGEIVALDGVRWMVDYPVVPGGFESWLPRVRTFADGKEAVVHPARFSFPGGSAVLNPDGTLLKSYEVNTVSGMRTRKVEKVSADLNRNEMVYSAKFGTDGTVLHEQKGEFTRIFKDGVYHVYRNGVLLRSY